MKKYSLLLAAALLFCTACQKVVDADNLLDTEEKVFIRSYIAPQDTVLRVDVLRALPSFGTPLSVDDQEANRAKFLIKDAIVRISDEEGNVANLSYVDSLETYLTDATNLSIEGQKQYFLEVDVENKTFNASCRIPEQVGAIEEQIRLEENEYGFVDTEVSLRFTDLLGARNFYMLGGNYKVTLLVEGEEPQVVDGQLFFGSDQFVTDALEDGALLSGESFGSISFGNDTEILNRSITLQVLHMNEIIFQNLRTASINSNNEGNPFVEYAIAPTNFSDEGAVGVFAGYQLTEKVIEIED